MVLEVCRLWVIVEGTEKEPATSTTDEEKEAWRTKNQAAWKKLSERYKGKGEQRIAYLIGELFWSTFTDDASLEPQINGMCCIGHTLTALGNKLDNKLIAVALILSLPPSYDTLKMILTSVQSLDIDNVMMQVMQEEQHHHESAATTAFLVHSSGGKNFSKGSSSGSPGSGSGKSKVYCKFCKALAGDAVAKVVMVCEPDDSAIHIFKASADALAKRPDLTTRWLVDSGTSQIMSCICDWFTMYQAFDTLHKVWLGNNSSIDAHGIRCIPVLMQAKGEWHKVILSDALYILDLHGNLISVLQITCCSTHVQFLESSCEIYDQQGTLTCEGRLEDNLYIINARSEIP
ncbi:hypothetical protein EWM64_g182 [Hericium alpestre]|uniref:Retrovirus-related Pol polyprotein from transposon TNT 1-94-like beta-barrel domain-containing protein n=1 Tax=Hericium alpestre TaxID=135208 RepID=A0A4Z0A9N7_9AGAM|nr:hypothetical protein EWM64_g182 [Hericium alpestre]